MNHPPVPQTDPLVARGEVVGRFVVLGPVGRGGMGEVYAAYDPELDRKVAVKLLRSRLSSSPSGEARLLREAQAIAKLSHPNVVVVYDVGTFRDKVFLAMEYVEGSTASFWLEQEIRPWREVLRIFLAAGRGLGAAHGAGMIHRDFKPENVMITRDGQVRVMDFGLARQVSADGEAPLTERGAREAMDRARAAMADDSSLVATAVLSPPRGDPTASSGGYLNAKLTQTGTQLGTPAYMAPEQFVPGVRIDARTDQFSFCVALYEGLYGQRPFPGDTMVALMASVLQGKVRQPPEKTRVPTRIRRVLLRGLATDPNQRYPSMADLLAALEHDPASRRRRWLAGAGLSAAVAALVAAGTRVGARQQTMCEGAGEHLAGIWEPAGVPSPRKRSVHAAFLQTGKPYAEPSFRAASSLLDGYAARWSGLYREACQAHARGEQSAEVLDLRMACLQQRLGNLRALTDLFTAADDGVVLNASGAAGALQSLDPCSDVPVLRAVVKPPDDPAQQKRVAELRELLAELVALRDAGRCSSATARFDGLIASARALGYRPLLADVLDAAGILANNCGDPRQAFDRLREAFAVATAAHHDQGAAEAASTIPGLVANRLGQAEVGSEWLQIARAAVERVNADGNSLLDAWLLTAESLTEDAAHHADRALDAAGRALELKQRILGPDHPDTLSASQNVAVILQSAHRFAESLEVDVATARRIERVLGADHPLLAMVANNEGETLNDLGRHAEARAAYQRAIGIWRRAGSDPVLLSYGLAGLGTSLLGEDRPADAIAPLEEAVATVADRAAAVPATVRASWRFALARALWSRSEGRVRALTVAKEARADLGAGADPKASPVAELDAWLEKARRLIK